MTRTLVGALLLAGLGSLGCSRPSTTGEPTGADAKPPASVEAPGEAAAGIVSELDELPPWFRDLLDPEPRRTYAWSYEVPTHGEDPAVVGAQGKLRCRSDGPTRHELPGDGVALVICHACDFTSEGQNDGFEPELDECWVATPQGLWLVGGPPKDDDEARALVATLPYLPATPEPRHETHPREKDGFPYEDWTDVAERQLEVMGHPVTAWCREDGSSLLYGWRMTRCFATGLGLVAFEHEGRSGPSSERYELVAVEPP